MTATAVRPAGAPAASVHPDLPLTPRARGVLGNVALVLLAYVPTLLTAPGRVEADTKSYLYLDAGRFLQGAASMWDPHIGLGTVSHQTLGYLFPVGPFYWLLQDVAGLPSWVAQRLWLGTLICAAGFGMQYLLRTFALRGPGVPVGVAMYAFTPYVLQYSSRLSVLLGPWAALPWLIAFVVSAIRRGGWRYPALFALTIQLVSSINASAMIFALVGPMLWFPYSWLVLRERTFRSTLAAGLRISVLTLLTSLWWMSGLAVQSQYGLNILRFTESMETVSATSYPAEILRGLGYWFFYGRDRTTFWNDALIEYTQSPERVLLSFLLPATALTAAALLRWRHRAFFVVLVLVGLAIAVAAAPFDDPSPVGSVFKTFALSSTAGFALRSTARAVPLIVLGFAVLTAAGVNALHAHLRSRGAPRAGLVVAAVLAVAAVANSAGVLHGAYYSEYLLRDEEVPEYWQEAIAALDAGDHATRVLALPGADFAAYRWGNTIDPIEPGLMDRDYVARELVPWGSEPAANLLQSLDHRLQEGTFERGSLAPIARLMGVGDVVLRMDLETDRFALVPAGQLWQTFTEAQPEGLGPPVPFGTEIPGELTFPEVENPARPPHDEPPPVAVLGVEDPVPIIRAKSGADPLVVSGDGEGLVDLAAAGLLDADRVVLYSASFEDDRDALRSLPEGATLVLTDSHRRRGLRWPSQLDNSGYTEAAGEEPLADDPLDQRLAVFPEASDDTRTVTELEGARSLRATSYGSQVFGYTTSQRPSAAFDGDDETLWAVAPGQEVGPERIEVALDEPVTTDHITLSQPQGPPRSRYISRITLTFDGTESVTARLDPSSRSEDGQRVDFPERTFSSLAIRIDGVRQHRGRALVTKNPVGFNEIRIVDDAPGSTPVRITEVARLPRDLLDGMGAAAADHPLLIVLSRESTMDRVGMRRAFTIPDDRSFSVTGTMQISGFSKDDAIDRALGLPGAHEGGLTVRSTRRVADPLGRGSQALDGDPSTAWNASVGDGRDPRLEVELPERTELSRLDLQLVVDGRHSVPTELEIRAVDGERRLVELPRFDPEDDRGTVTVPVEFEPLTSRAFTVYAREFTPHEMSETLMPIGIAELGIPGVRRAPVPTVLPDRCLTGVIEVDGQPLPVRVSGTTEDALREALPFEPCDPDSVLALGAGDHEVDVTMNPRNRSGFDVRRVVLASDATGAPADPAALATGDEDGRPDISVVRESRTKTELRVDGATEPFWLVLGQSSNAGWRATVDGRDIGRSVLVDGFANGWRIEPDPDGTTTSVTLEWVPQRRVRTAVVVSTVTSALCLALAVAGLIRRRRRTGDDADEAADTPALDLALVPARLAPRWGSTAATAATVGLAAGLLVEPWVGVLGAVVAGTATRVPVVRAAMRLYPPAMLVVVAFAVSGGQLFERYPPRFDWTTFFGWARIPVWLAVVFLAADALITHLWRIESGAPRAIADPDLHTA